MAEDLVVAVVVDDAQAIESLEVNIPGATKKTSAAVQEMADKNIAAMRAQMKTLGELQAAYKEMGATSGKAAWESSVPATQAALNSTEKQLAAISALPVSTGRSLDAIAQKSVQVGKTMSRALTLPIVLAFGVATKMFIDFQRQMEMVHTQAGAPQREVAAQSKALLAYATSGQSVSSPLDLAKALYFSESRGYRGKEATELTKIVSQFAGLGNAPIVDVANAIGGVLTTYIRNQPTLKQVKKYGGIVDAIIGQGAMTMEEFTGSMRTGVAAAGVGPGGAGSKPLVGLKEIGAALDVLTDRGMPAQMAATRLRMTIAMMEKPTQAATKALGDLGIRQYQLVNTMKSSPDGMIKAMMLLQAAYQRMSKKGKADQAEGDILQIFGKGRSSAGILTILNSLTSNVSSFEGKFATITAQSKATNERLARYNETTSAKIAKAWNAIKASFIDMGGSIAPTVAALAEGISLLVRAFAAIPGPLRGDIGIILALAAALGPILYIGGNIVRTYRAVTGALEAFGQMSLRSSQKAVVGAEEANLAIGAEREAALAQSSGAMATIYTGMQAEEYDLLQAEEATNAALGPQRAAAAAEGAAAVEEATAAETAANAGTLASAEALNTASVGVMGKLKGMTGALGNLAAMGSILVGLTFLVETKGEGNKGLLGAILSGAGIGGMIGGPAGAIIGGSLGAIVDLTVNIIRGTGWSNKKASDQLSKPYDVDIANGMSSDAVRAMQHTSAQMKALAPYWHYSPQSNVWTRDSIKFDPATSKFIDAVKHTFVPEKTAALSYGVSLSALRKQEKTAIMNFIRTPGGLNEYYAGHAAEDKWWVDEHKFEDGRKNMLRTFVKHMNINKAFAALGLNIGGDVVSHSSLGSKVAAAQAHTGDVVFAGKGTIVNGVRQPWTNEGMITGYKRFGDGVMATFEPIIRALGANGKMRQYIGYDAFAGGTGKPFQVRDLTVGAASINSGHGAGLHNRIIDNTQFLKEGRAAAAKITSSITNALRGFSANVSAAIKSNASPGAIEGAIQAYIKQVNDAIATVTKNMKTKNPAERQALMSELSKLDAVRTKLHAELLAEITKAQLAVLSATFKRYNSQYSIYSKRIQAVQSLNQYSQVVGGRNSIPGVTTNFSKIANQYLNNELATLNSELATLKNKLASAKIPTVKQAIQGEISKLQSAVASVNNSIEQQLEATVSQAQQVYQQALQNVQNQLGTIGQDIITQFNEQTQKGLKKLQKRYYQGSGAQTPQEMALQAFQDQMNADQLNKALADATQKYLDDLSSGADLKTIQDDSYALQQVQKERELKQLEDAARQSRINADRAYAIAEQAYVDKRQIQEQHLQKALKDLEDQVASGKKTFKDTGDVVAALQPIMKLFGVHMDGVPLDQFKIDMSSMSKALLDPSTGLVPATQKLQTAFGKLLKWVNKIANVKLQIIPPKPVKPKKPIKPAKLPPPNTGHGKAGRRPGTGSSEPNIHVKVDVHGSIIGNDLDAAAKQLAGPIRAELTKTLRRNATPVGL